MPCRARRSRRRVSPTRVWLAQGPAGQGLEAYGAVVSVPVLDPATAAPVIRPLLERGGVVCHDLKSSSALRTLVGQAGHDTYVAAYLLAPNRRDYPLAELAREAGLRAPECVPQESGAAAAALVIALAERQETELREQGMWDLFRDIELPLTAVLISMEMIGIHLDCYRLGEIAGKIQDQLEELETRIHELAGEPFNLGSSQQMGRVLFDRLGLPRQRKTKTGYSTDAKSLESLRDSHPIVGYILNHRELSKLMSTYLLALPPVVHQDTGRLHTTFNQTVAATGRLSSSDPNLQNIPVRTAVGAQIRQCFRAEMGSTFVVADYSQIELHIMAHLSGEPVLLESFARGEDIHTRTAAEVFGLDESEVDPTHRRYAKAVNFGIMYGISAFGLSQNLGIQREEAAAYIQAYFDRLPRVKAFIESTIETARRQGYVTTVFGRRRDIPEFASPNFQTRSLGERLAVNSIIQGTAADIIKVAMIRCYQRLNRDFPGRGWSCRYMTSWCSRFPKTRRRLSRRPWWKRWSRPSPWIRRWGWTRASGPTGSRPSKRPSGGGTAAGPVCCISLTRRYTTRTTAWRSKNACISLGRETETTCQTNTSTKANRHSTKAKRHCRAVRT